MRNVRMMARVAAVRLANKDADFATSSAFLRLSH
jgi:hypothetical protein